MYQKTGPSKPPRPRSNTQPQTQQTLYSDFNSNNIQQQPYNPTDFVIIHINSDNNNLNEFSSIGLSSTFQEKDSFSFVNHNNNSFENNSNSIYNALHQRVWITQNPSDIQILENTFKHYNKQTPQSISIINANEIFNNYPSFTINKSRNSRYGCDEVYTTLQRISLFNLLTPQNNTLSPMQPNIDNRQNDFISPSDQYIPSEPIKSPIPSNQFSSDFKNNTQQINDQQYNVGTDNIVEAPINPSSVNTQQINDQFVNDKPLNVQQEQIVVDNNINNNINNPSNTYQPNGYHPDSDVVVIQSPLSTDQQQPVLNEDNNSSQINLLNDNNNQQPVLNEEEPVLNDNTEPQIDENMIESEPKISPHSTDINQSPIINQIDVTPPSANIANMQQTAIITPSAPTSWADRFKSNKKPSSVSPKRPTFHVVHNVSGPLGQSTTPEGIRKIINDAIQQNKRIWISYDGHKQPFIPREIQPKSWINSGGRGSKVDSFYAVQHKSKSGNKQRFYLKYVQEVRDRRWVLPKGELDRKMKKYKQRIAQQQRWQNNYNNQQNNDTSYNTARPYNSGRRSQNTSNYNQQNTSRSGGKRKNKSTSNSYDSTSNKENQ